MLHCILNTAAFWLNAAFHHWPKGFRALSDEIPKPSDILWASLVAHSDGKETACNAGDLGSNLGSVKSLGEGNGNPLQYFLPGDAHRQNSLVGYSPWDHKELDMTEATDSVPYSVVYISVMVIKSHVDVWQKLSQYCKVIE